MKRLGLLVTFLLFLNGCATAISTVNPGETIEEDPGRRSFGAMVDDSSIETAIKVNLNANEALKRAHISVVSFNGTVLLVGQVPSQDLKNEATRIATSASASRIKTVHNELEVAGATTFLSRSNDAWLTAKLKTLMLADPTIAGLRTKVVTENGVVYLMGLVSQAEANQTVDLVSNASGVTKVVRAFEYID
jgi:osmotically-inducible protein OsmY